jgi:two-component system chemotaxis response regulator CheV
MPQMRHPSVLGAFSHRDGKVVPLVNLARYLDKQADITDDAKIIVTEFNHILTGFLVSGVNRIHRLNWNDVEEPGNFLQNVSRNSITGVVRLENRVVFLLDLEHVVADMDPALAIHLDKLDEVAGGGHYTILHADDSGSVRRLVKDLLENSGVFTVVQAVSGEEAWAILGKIKSNCEAREKNIRSVLQAVISDIEMPRMDGLTLCRKIKEDPVLKVLPVALFSSIVSHSLEHKGESVGADAQFAKPDLQMLSQKLLDLIGRDRKEQRLETGARDLGFLK